MSPWVSQGGALTPLGWGGASSRLFQGEMALEMTSRGGLGGLPKRNAKAPPAERMARGNGGRSKKAQSSQGNEGRGGLQVWPVALHKVGLRTDAQRGSYPALPTGCFKMKTREPAGVHHDKTWIILGSYGRKGPKTHPVGTDRETEAPQRGRRLLELPTLLWEVWEEPAFRGRP